MILAALALAGCGASPSPSSSIDSALAAAAATEFTVVSNPQEAFPTWSGKDLDGYAWNSTNLGGSFVVVNFWASWCQPCIDEWAQLQQAAAEHPTVQFLGVNTKDDLPSARAFLKDHPSEYRHVFDTDAVILKGLTSIPNSTMPTTVILDGAHRIVAWKVGPTKVEQLRRVLRTLYDARKAA